MCLDSIKSRMLGELIQYAKNRWNALNKSNTPHIGVWHRWALKPLKVMGVLKMGSISYSVQPVYKNWSKWKLFSNKKASYDSQNDDSVAVAS